jgi:hemerythrin
VTFQRFDTHAADLGVPALDAEHRGQIELMNHVGEAITAGFSAVEITAAVDSLVGYLEAHFMSEQIAFREQGYPGYEAHQAEHDEAIALLRGLHTRAAAGDVRAMLEILGGLETWLVQHIRSSDAAFARFVLEKEKA